MWMDLNSLHKRKPISNMEWQLHSLRNKLIDTVKVHLHCTKAMSFSDNYHPQTKFGAPVCHCVHRGGGKWAGTSPGQVHHPGQLHPLGSYTPGQLHPPPPGSYTPSNACWDTVKITLHESACVPRMHSCSTRQLHWLTARMKEIVRFRICLRLV